MMDTAAEPDRFTELLAELGPVNVALILAAFFGDARAQLEKLATANHAADFLLLCQVAHSLAGAAANVGAEPLAHYARTLEHGVAAMSRPAIQRQLDDMAVAFAVFAAAHDAAAHYALAG